MLKGSNLVQVKRFIRLGIFTVLTQLPLLLNAAAGITWKNIVSLVGVPLLEVIYRATEPATPDVATSPPAAGDQPIPPLG